MMMMMAATTTAILVWERNPSETSSCLQLFFLVAHSSSFFPFHTVSKCPRQSRQSGLDQSEKAQRRNRRKEICAVLDIIIIINVIRREPVGRVAVLYTRT